MLINCGTCRHAVWERTPSGRINKNAAGKCGVDVNTTDKLIETISTLKLPTKRRNDLNIILAQFQKYPIWILPHDYENCEAWEPKDA